jgi:hypothetical protein
MEAICLSEKLGALRNTCRYNLIKNELIWNKEEEIEENWGIKLEEK